MCGNVTVEPLYTTNALTKNRIKVIYRGLHIQRDIFASFVPPLLCFKGILDLGEEINAFCIVKWA
jgi:hypothetical protein